MAWWTGALFLPGFLLVVFAPRALTQPGIPPDRMERWFLIPPRVPQNPKPYKTVTTTITATRVISEVWLSSCVTHEASLPTCPRDGRRGEKWSAVRSTAAAVAEPGYYNLDPREIAEGKGEGRAVRPSRVEPILSTEPPHLPHHDSKRNIKKFKMFSKPFWEDVVGLAFPHRNPVDRLPSFSTPTPPLPPRPIGHNEGAITRTVSVTETTRVKGPKTVVSFSIAGCLPSKLPFDLEPCEKDAPKDAHPRVPSLRLPSDMQAPEGGSSSTSSASPASEESPATPEASSPSKPPSPTPSESTDMPDKTPVEGETSPQPEEQSHVTEVAPGDNQQPESEQMMPASNSDAATYEAPEEEIGSGFS